MKKNHILVVISAVCVALSIIYTSVAVSPIPQSRVELTTNPPLERVHPFEAEAETQSPVTLTLQAVNPAGQALANALIDLEILTPASTPWLTTDFPIVEGTKLLKMSAIAPEGKLEIQQILPIRGKYQIKAHVSPLVANTFTAFEQNLSLNIHENPVKYKYFVIVAAILLSMGLLGGWVIGGQKTIREGEIAPQSVRLLLSALTIVAIITLLLINISAEVAEAHGSEHSHQEKAVIAPSTQKLSGLEFKIDGDQHATVGKLANFTVQLKEQSTGKAINDVALKVQATALEHDLTVFTYQGIPNSEGKLTWQQQFFDGSPHKVEIEAVPLSGTSREFTPIKVAQEVDVEGIAPPMYIRLISLFYLTAIVGVGMAIGLLIQHRRQPSLTNQ